MSVIKKPDLKIFAQDAKTGEIETFPDVLRGWGITLERTAGKPPLEWFNAIGKRVDEWLMYLTQRGLAEWDSSVDYPKDALVQHSSVFYVALKITKGEQPNTSQSAWKPLVDFLGVNNKLDKTAIVQTTGESTTSVMSQKASTDTFQPKGNYANGDNFSVHTGSSAVRSPNKLYTLEIQNDGQMVVGDATSGTPKAVIRFTKEGELSVGSVPANKVSGLSKGVGVSESAIMSQKASTDSFQPKGDYATNQSLTEGLNQKFDKTGGYVAGFVVSEGELGVKTGDRHISIITSDAVRGPHIAVRENANEGYGRFSFPSKSGTFLASGDISQTTGASTTSVMSQKASTDAFQIKGDYATKSEMNVELNKKVDKANISQQLANDVNKVPSLDLLAKELGRKQASGDYALRGESYTKSESDAKYQPKGNYGAKNTANKASSGWWKCGDTGVIYQWGDAKGCITADQTRNFPIAFPNACVQIVACYANFDDYGMGVAAMPINNSSFVVTARNHAGYAGDGVVRYIAVGY
ncbi:TPA: hypothetical protein ACKRMM_005919 [Pseudomonas aeruginosa]